MSQGSGGTVSEMFRRPGDLANTDKNPHFNQSCRKIGCRTWWSWAQPGEKGQRPDECVWSP